MLLQGELVTIDRKVDDNWFSGAVGDKKGIFPITYVKIIEGEHLSSSQLRLLLTSHSPY